MTDDLTHQRPSFMFRDDLTPEEQIELAEAIEDFQIGLHILIRYIAVPMPALSPLDCEP